MTLSNQGRWFFGIRSAEVSEFGPVHDLRWRSLEGASGGQVHQGSASGGRTLGTRCGARRIRGFGVCDGICRVRERDVARRQVDTDHQQHLHRHLNGYRPPDDGRGGDSTSAWTMRSAPTGESSSTQPNSHRSRRPRLLSTTGRNNECHQRAALCRLHHAHRSC